MRETAPRACYRCQMDVSPEIVAIVAVGIGLAGLILRATSRQDADRRAFQKAMDDFRTEMQRLAERQSHVEGRIDARAGD